MIDIPLSSHLLTHVERGCIVRSSTQTSDLLLLKRQFCFFVIRFLWLAKQSFSLKLMFD